MRVIAGKARGTKLTAVPGSGTRPILDRVKTSLFDILRPELTGATVLDLFAGTGGVGIEALSQGAASCTFVEQDSRACEIIQKNLDATHLADCARIRRGDVFRHIAESTEQYDLIYIAPPQYRDLWLKTIAAVDARPELLRSGGRVVVQIDPRELRGVPLINLEEQRQRKYGNTLLLFYGARGEAGDSDPSPERGAPEG